MNRIAFVVSAFLLTSLSSAQFSLSLNKSVVAGANYVQGTITLDAVAGSDSVFETYDNSSLVTTPPNVTVYTGTLSRVFGIQTMAITSTVVTTIYARRNFVTRSQMLTLAPLIPIAMEFTPNPVVGGTGLSCRVVVNGVAGPGGRTISIFDNSAYSDVPASVIVPAGGTQVSFPIATRTVPTNHTVTVTARVSAGATQGSFRITTGPAPDTRMVFFSTRDGNSEVYRMNADGSNQVNLTNSAFTDQGPSWSIDHASIAFASDQYGQGFTKIYTMNADGGNVQQVSSNGSFSDFFAEWSPSAGVSFTTNRHVDYEIYLGGVRLTNSLGNDQHGAWSPDGTKVVFESARNINQELWIMNADGSNPVQLTFGDGNFAYPSWSPDGSRIAFSGIQGGSQEIFTIKPDGTDLRQLTNNTEVDADPCWSPSGTKIAFHSGRDGNFEIYTMNINGTNQTNITNSLGDDRAPSWR